MRTAILVAAVALTAAACGSADVVETSPAPTTSEVASNAAGAASPAPIPTSTPELERQLFDAARADDLTGVRDALDRGADLEARGDGGRTPLVAATKANAVAAATALIDAGADVNAQDDMQDSAFLYAGAEGLNDILLATLDHGADVRSTNRFGGTALIPASEHGHIETVRILIRAGVPVNHVNDPGWTALLEAVVYGDGSARYVDTVTQLLDAGADPSIRDARGLTALQNAHNRGQRDIAVLLAAADGG
ncbi:ankyrin repeat domain-containing protein [Prescottella defluvii]|uniref:ankyrin repeat domain-containing protein n=1 Tax=Prescottella defluvii TaxID=1323361 RepID=UPI0004F32432|nr:ankyrin repeat domain-containing protein [Prescottella defluvii]